MSGMRREDVINYGAGPSNLPTEVLEGVRDELLNWSGSGMSVMEMSHRSKYFNEIQNETLGLARELLQIPDQYDTLLLQGGATTQFSAVPLNMLSSPSSTCDYLVTGGWSARAQTEASVFGNANIVANGKDPKLGVYTNLPPVNEWKVSASSEYLYYCENETVFGVELGQNVVVDGAKQAYQAIGRDDVPPIVADVSSNFYSRSMNISEYGVVYGGAQKNLGPSGVTLCIIDKEFSRKEPEYPRVPKMLQWKTAAENDSRYNTPPTFGIYIMGRVLTWLKDAGGVEAISEINDEKSRMVYRAIDESDLFVNVVDPSCRSRMNIPFRILKKGTNPIDGQWDIDLESQFIAQAEKEGLLMLKGHRTAGGMRASLYNSIKKEGAEKLVAFMEKFVDTNQRK